jgi:hypothetical protein
MAIRDRSLFNNPELDFMMPDAAPPGAALGPTGAGDPVLDLLTPPAPSLGGGINAGGVPSFQTDVMGHTPAKESEFLNQLSAIELNKLLQLAGDYERAFKGGDVEPYPRYVYDAITAEITKRQSIAGQAIIERDRVPAAGVVVGSPLESLQNMVDTVVEMGKETGKDIKEDWQTVKAELGMPAEEGEKRLEEIKKEKEARVKPEDIRGDIITAMSQGEDVELPPTFTEGIDISKVGRKRKEPVEDDRSMLGGIRKIIQRSMPDNLTDNFYDFVGRGAPVPEWGEPGPEGPAGAEIITKDETQIIGSDGEDKTVVTQIVEDVDAVSKGEKQGIIIDKNNVDGVMDQFVETTLNPAVRNTTTNPTLKMMQETPEIIQMAATINRYVNGGRVPDARDAFFDLLDGIAAGLASEINPGVGIAKGAALGNAKFQERVAKEKENKIKSIEEANDYLSTLSAYDAAVAKAKAGGVPSGSEMKALDDLSKRWLASADGVIVADRAINTVNEILGAIEQGKLPVGIPGFTEEMAARFQTLTGDKSLRTRSERLELKDKLQKITQQSLQAILNESGRTISDRDRQLIADLIGDLKLSWAGITTPLGNLQEKLISFRNDFTMQRNSKQVEFDEINARNDLYPFLMETNAVARRRQEIQNLGSIPVYQDVGGVITIVSRVPE